MDPIDLTDSPERDRSTLDITASPCTEDSPERDRSTLDVTLDITASPCTEDSPERDRPPIDITASPEPDESNRDVYIDLTDDPSPIQRLSVNRSADPPLQRRLDAELQVGAGLKVPEHVHLLEFGFDDEDKKCIKDFAEEVCRYTREKESQGFLNPMAVHRGKGRLDIQCDALFCLLRARGEGRAAHPFVTQHKPLCEQMLSLIQRRIPALLDELERIGVKYTSKTYCYISVFVIFPGAPAQRVHNDADGDKTYHTCFVPVSDHPGQGSTEFGETEPFATFPNVCKMWRGDVRHRGGENRSSKPRYEFAVVVSENPDENRDRFTRQSLPLHALKARGGV